MRITQPNLLSTTDSTHYTDGMPLVVSLAIVLLCRQERDAKLNETMDELANVTALYNEAKTEISQAKADKEELDELRELKSDIDRKDKQNAMIIENQVSGVLYSAAANLLWSSCMMRCHPDLLQAIIPGAS